MTRRADGRRNSIRHIDKEALEQVFQEVDTDHSGDWDWAEFLALVTRRHADQRTAGGGGREGGADEAPQEEQQEQERPLLVQRPAEGVPAWSGSAAGAVEAPATAAGAAS